MNRFFRSALFPLIIIAALVWLALQTLGSHGTKTTQQTTSQVYHARSENAPGHDRRAGLVDPNKQSTLPDARRRQEVHRPLRRRRSREAQIEQR